MLRQLHYGLIEYEDGKPASTPQMVNDVANFIIFIQRRSGWGKPDKKVRQSMFIFGCFLLFPIAYIIWVTNIESSSLQRKILDVIYTIKTTIQFDLQTNHVMNLLIL